MDIRVVVIVVKYIEGIEMRVDTCFARCLEPMDESHSQIQRQRLQHIASIPE